MYNFPYNTLSKGDFMSYKQQIIEMLEVIENEDILKYLYKIIVDIKKEDKRMDAEK